MPGPRMAMPRIRATTGRIIARGGFGLFCLAGLIVATASVALAQSLPASSGDSSDFWPPASAGNGQFSALPPFPITAELPAVYTTDANPPAAPVTPPENAANKSAPQEASTDQSPASTIPNRNDFWRYRTFAEKARREIKSGGFNHSRPIGGGRRLSKRSTPPIPARTAFNRSTKTPCRKPRRSIWDCGCSMKRRSISIQKLPGAAAWRRVQGRAAFPCSSDSYSRRPDVPKRCIARLPCRSQTVGLGGKRKNRRRSESTRRNENCHALQRLPSAVNTRPASSTKIQSTATTRARSS